MRKIPLAEATPGLRLARPVRRLDGTVLLQQGVVLDQGHLARMAREGIEELMIAHDGERLPEQVPEYMDRYGPDFPQRLQQMFSRTMTRATMQHLFLQALMHAGTCYKRYRLADDEERASGDSLPAPDARRQTGDG